MGFNKMMEEVWRWKEEVAKETEGMSPQELFAYYKRVERQSAEKTGVKLDLPRLPGPRRERRGSTG